MLALNAESVSFSEPVQDSIKHGLPRNQAATRAEVCRVRHGVPWAGKVPAAASSLTLLLSFTRREEEESTAALDDIFQPHLELSNKAVLKDSSLEPQGAARSGALGHKSLCQVGLGGKHGAGCCPRPARPSRICRVTLCPGWLCVGGPGWGLACSPLPFILQLCSSRAAPSRRGRRCGCAPAHRALFGELEVASMCFIAAAPWRWQLERVSLGDAPRWSWAPRGCGPLRSLGRGDINLKTICAAWAKVAYGNQQLPDF